MLCLKCNFEFQDAEEFCPNCGAACTQIQNPLGLNKLSTLLAGTIAEGKYRIESSGIDRAGRLYEAICLTTNKKVILEKARLPEAISPIEKGDEAESAQAIETDQSTQGQISVDYDYTPTVSLRERYELLSSLDNAECPKVYDYFTSGSTEYLVLEPPAGNHLVSFVDENGVTEDSALDIIISLCEHIEEIHRRGYLHLNIEPSNIYYLPDGQVRLFDFSRAIKQGTVLKNYLTNEGFSPPELMLPDGATIDARADIYSIGAVMLWMLSGEKVTLVGMSPSKIVSSVSSPELARILLPCLTADVNSRYRIVSELRDRLQAYHALKKKWSFRYDSASLTDIGMSRLNNEDACLSLELSQSIGSKTVSYGIYLVADGMGGHAAGEVASAKAVEKISSSILEAVNSPDKSNSFSEAVKESVEKANDEIYNMAQSNPRLSAMGTTVTLGVRISNELYLGHVGDSRCYFVRDGKIKQLTRDHSVVGGLLERGMITPEQAKLHPDRGKICRCLGSAAEVSIDTCETTGYGEKLILQDGDELAFCTDGLTNDVSDEEILECVEKKEDAYAVCRDLVRLANVKGGDDNISVIVVRVIGER
jgi:protein phosphatase